MSGFSSLTLPRAAFVCLPATARSRSSSPLGRPPPTAVSMATPYGSPMQVFSPTERNPHPPASCGAFTYQGGAQKLILVTFTFLEAAEAFKPKWDCVFKCSPGTHSPGLYDKLASALGSSSAMAERTLSTYQSCSPPNRGSCLRASSNGHLHAFSGS